ncbi:MAG: MFS transporter [Candidatus Korobacteraceae bacterium]|jgi:putative MFS transporter
MSTTALDLYDNAPLNRRFWFVFCSISLVLVFEFFDFYIVGFLLAVLGPQWHLTYGQSSIILLSAGLGSIFGAFVWGKRADVWGRKVMIAIGTMICAAGSGFFAIVPDGAWLTFASLRFVVGFGLGASVTPCITMAVELTPTRHRSFIPGLIVGFSVVGTLVASGTAAFLLSVLGWRGVSVLGLAPLVPGLMVWLLVPESVRWLISRGRTSEARAVVARQLNIPLELVPPAVAGSTVAAQPKPTLRELYSSDPARFWFTLVAGLCLSTAGYGVNLWGPTIIAMVLKISVKEVGHIFIYVACSGIIGKLIFSFLPHYIGRRPCGQIYGYGIFITLGLAGWFHASFLGSVSMFVVFLCIGAIFFDGGHSTTSPYAAEIFPVRLAAGGVGLLQGANGVGKILGPVSLALLAGTNNLITPKATSEAVVPGFLFLAGCGLCVGVAFTLYRKETRGRALALRDEVKQIPKSDGVRVSSR